MQDTLNSSLNTSFSNKSFMSFRYTSICRLGCPAMATSLKVGLVTTSIEQKEVLPQDSGLFFFSPRLPYQRPKDCIHSCFLQVTPHLAHPFNPILSVILTKGHCFVLSSLGMILPSQIILCFNSNCSFLGSPETSSLYCGFRYFSNIPTRIVSLERKQST